MTWRYVNKNGSQDMRFSNNYEIPIVRYADIIFESKAGMREVFMFSHFDRAKAFQTSIDTYLRDLKGNPEGQHSRAAPETTVQLEETKAPTAEKSQNQMM